MKPKIITLAGALAMFSMTAIHAYEIEWDKIKFWTGEGDKRAALVVQFEVEDGVDNPGAIVWGYRWSGDDAPTGHSMICDIARNSPDLIILTQYTGNMGNTLDGIGYASDVSRLVDNLMFDFDGASTDSRISFDYFTPNTIMGQISAPGQEGLNMIYDALAESQETHIINHPLDYATCGYPAYDYDWWQLQSTAEGQYWNAGWYDGYWSYYVGGTDLDDLAYSGLGMSSVNISDNMVNAWKFRLLNDDSEEVDGYSGASPQWLEPNYTHFDSESATSLILHPTPLQPTIIYRPDGSIVTTHITGDYLNLSPGFYIVKQGNTTKKIYIK